MTEETATKDVRRRGPYLEHDRDVILFVPDIDNPSWRSLLQYEGFLQLGDLWIKAANTNSDQTLLRWRQLYDDAFPGLRDADPEADAWLENDVRRSTALPTEHPYGRSRLWK